MAQLANLIYFEIDACASEALLENLKQRTLLLYWDVLHVDQCEKTYSSKLKLAKTIVAVATNNISSEKHV